MFGVRIVLVNPEEENIGGVGCGMGSRGYQQDARCLESWGGDDTRRVLIRVNRAVFIQIVAGSGGRGQMRFFCA